MSELAGYVELLNFIYSQGLITLHLSDIASKCVSLTCAFGKY